MIDVLMTPRAVIMMIGIVAGLTTAVAVAAYVRRFFQNRPRTNTSARDRLLAHNPMLADGRELRWTVAARRARTGVLTALVISAAVLVVSSRPRLDASSSDATA